MGLNYSENEYISDIPLSHKESPDRVTEKYYKMSHMLRERLKTHKQDPKW